jgi:molybdenum cofactor synthesis domain-containing protein
VLADAIVADTDLPPFDRAQMDGYAVRAADTASAPVKLRVAGEAAAGRGWRGHVNAGEAVRIMTGAPVPHGADSVQRVEVTREANGEVYVDEATHVEQFIVRRASEIEKGATVIEPRERITAEMVATLAAFGYAQVRVHKRPRVAVMATGAELVAVGAQPAEDQIRDSNSLMLAAYATQAGADAEPLPRVADDLVELKRTIGEAAERSDVVVLTGGVSVGVYDYTKLALVELGAEIFFERLRLRPGKPTVFARLNQTLVFGLPGNPVSAAVTFNMFTRTALLLMQNARNARLAEETAALGGRIKRNAERTSYLPAKLSVSAEGVSTNQSLCAGAAHRISSRSVAPTRSPSSKRARAFSKQARSCASHVFHEIKFLMTKLTHTDEDGRATMVDVSGKTPTERRAVASARVLMNAETISAIREARTPKGDPLRNRAPRRNHGGEAHGRTHTALPQLAALAC